MFLPILLPRLRDRPRIDARSWGYLIFSGFAGSAVGTVFFTLALKNGNPTVVNVLLNIQPVISTLGAWLLFRDRLTPAFFLYAGIAIGLLTCGFSSNSRSTPKRATRRRLTYGQKYRAVTPHLRRNGLTPRLQS
jgi:drug/metabolite transporter (DMT)-like permease